MIVIPAIDIKDGRCVRLLQGDYSQVTVFADDPRDVACRWREAGAPIIHAVDLDGAAAGYPVNLATVKSLVEATALPIQLGGGVRTLATIEAVLGVGVSRVILGTAAVEDGRLVAEASQRWGDSIAVAIDSKDGLVATRGWLERTTVRATDLARAMVDLGVTRLICTDISRDGTLTEPNYSALAEVISAVSIPVIASGGVSQVEHLKRLRDLGAEAAIVGRALYTGHIDYRDALAALR